MHKLIALYHPPASAEAFSHHLINVHLPLVAAFPGLRELRYGTELEASEGPSPYFAFVECIFDNADACRASLASPEAEAAAEDVPNYAGAGVTILTCDVVEVDLPSRGNVTD